LALEIRRGAEEIQLRLRKFFRHGAAGKENRHIIGHRQLVQLFKKSADIPIQAR